MQVEPCFFDHDAHQNSHGRHKQQGIPIVHPAREPTDHQERYEPGEQEAGALGS